MQSTSVFKSYKVYRSSSSFRNFLYESISYCINVHNFPCNLGWCSISKFKVVFNNHWVFPATLPKSTKNRSLLRKEFSRNHWKRAWTKAHDGVSNVRVHHSRLIRLVSLTNSFFNWVTFPLSTRSRHLIPSQKYVWLTLRSEEHAS